MKDEEYCNIDSYYTHTHVYSALSTAVSELLQNGQ